MWLWESGVSIHDNNFECYCKHNQLTEYPESVDSAVQGEKRPQDLRGVHTEQAATSHSVHPVVHLSAWQQTEAEHISGARHGKAPVHHPILFTVQENFRICRQVPGMETSWVTGC